MESAFEPGRHPLDNPVRSSLLGPHAAFAERRGNLLRYPPGMSPFIGMPDEPGPDDWRDAAALVGSGGIAFMLATWALPPDNLVAMAGERLRPPGYTEISAVCTDPAWRGQGLASRLTRAVAAVIMARGDTPFLHAVGTNQTAIRLYAELGFRLRRATVFSRARPLRFEEPRR